MTGLAMTCPTPVIFAPGITFNAMASGRSGCGTCLRGLQNNHIRCRGNQDNPKGKSRLVAWGLMDNLRQSWGESMTEDPVVSNPIEIVTDDTFETFVKGDGERLVVCQFTAEWCKPCQKIRPAVRKLAYAHSNVCFGSYECDKSRPELPTSQGVTSFPAFVLYKSGEKLGLLKGATCLGELMSVVSQHDNTD